MRIKDIFKRRVIRIEQQSSPAQFIGFNLKMQKGYKFLSNKEYNEAIETWLNVWNELMDYMKKNNIRTFKAFDMIYNGTQSVSNWVIDFENCLYTIVGNDINAEVLNVYGNLRISLNEQMIVFTDSENKSAIEDAKRAIAETYFFMGYKSKGEELFQKYLSENPKWGMGWIGWSDQYWLCKWQGADYVKGEEVLLKALEVSGLRDRGSVEDRLLELYSISEQDEKLGRLEEKLNNKKC